MIALTHLNDEIYPPEITTGSQRLFIKTLIENQRLMSDNPRQHLLFENNIRNQLYTSPHEVVHGLFLILACNQEIITEIRKIHKTKHVIVSPKNHLGIIIMGLKELWPKYYQDKILDRETVSCIYRLLKFISQMELDELTHFQALIYSFEKT